MSIGQSLSIVAAVVVSAVIIGFSIISQTPMSGTGEKTGDNSPTGNEQTSFSLRNIIQSITGGLSGQTKY